MPLSGNGGIASWANTYLATFPDENFVIYPVNNTRNMSNGHERIWSKGISGLSAMLRIKKAVSSVLSEMKPQLVHATTSGAIGSLRDYMVGKLCKRSGVKTILHCHYGCITEYVTSHSVVGKLVRMAMKQYDSIWVLDSGSYGTLKLIPEFKDKVFLTPNPILVPDDVKIKPKTYNRVGFVGNLLPSKGIFELTEAAVRKGFILNIIGPGSKDVIQRIKEIAGNCLGKNIFLHGLLPNDVAIEFIKKLDIVALPTYYPFEAFPMSILEAMSLGKLVISCPRAAIKDMLTGLDGKPCGILIKEKSSSAIAEAVTWAQNNPQQADKMCHEAYKKVKHSYDAPKVYEIYRKNYMSLLEN